MKTVTNDHDTKQLLYSKMSDENVIFALVRRISIPLLVATWFLPSEWYSKDILIIGFR